MAFEEAKFTPETEPQEVQVSSNELVFMIGESVVRDRQNLKRLQFLDNQVGLARDEALKAKSLAMAAEQKNVSFEQVKASMAEDYKQKVASFEQVKASLNDRIKQLENQVHETALERDKFRNELLSMEKRKPKRILKRVKSTPNTSGD